MADVLSEDEDYKLQKASLKHSIDSKLNSRALLKNSIFYCRKSGFT